VLQVRKKNIIPPKKFCAMYMLQGVCPPCWTRCKIQAADPGLENVDLLKAIVGQKKTSIAIEIVPPPLYTNHPIFEEIGGRFFKSLVCAATIGQPVYTVYTVYTKHTFLTREACQRKPRLASAVKRGPNARASI
jgi:hypothetical protein